MLDLNGTLTRILRSRKPGFQAGGQQVGTVSFRELPLVVKVATGVAFFTLWMCLEEFVINRSGFWRHMPYYKREDACVWDLAVALLIAAGLFVLSSTRVERRRADGS
jgi:hypothetical protein